MGETAAPWAILKPDCMEPWVGLHWWRADGHVVDTWRVGPDGSIEGAGEQLQRRRDIVGRWDPADGSVRLCVTELGGAVESCTEYAGHFEGEEMHQISASTGSCEAQPSVWCRLTRQRVFGTPGEFEPCELGLKLHTEADERQERVQALQGKLEHCKARLVSLEPRWRERQAHFFRTMEEGMGRWLPRVAGPVQQPERPGSELWEDGSGWQQLVQAWARAANAANAIQVVARGWMARRRLRELRMAWAEMAPISMGWLAKEELPFTQEAETPRNSTQWPDMAACLAQYSLYSYTDYVALVVRHQGQFDKAHDQIEKDLGAVENAASPQGRTTVCGQAGGATLFVGAGEWRERSRRVLLAFVRRAPQEGYCQGTNFVVASLLMAHCMDEEAVFWSLCGLAEGPLRGFWSPTLGGAIDYAEQLSRGSDRWLDGLSEYCAGCGMELGYMVMDWGQTILSKYIPPGKVKWLVSQVLTSGPQALLAISLHCLSLVRQEISPGHTGMDDLMWIKASPQPPGAR